MLTAEHRRPLGAFALVLAAACLIMANGLRTQVVEILVSSGGSRELISALAPDMVLGQSLRRTPPPRTVTVSEVPVTAQGPVDQPVELPLELAAPAPATTVEPPAASAPAETTRRSSSPARGQAAGPRSRQGSPASRPQASPRPVSPRPVSPRPAPSAPEEPRRGFSLRPAPEPGAPDRSLGQRGADGTTDDSRSFLARERGEQRSQWRRSPGKGLGDTIGTARGVVGRGQAHTRPDPARSQHTRLQVRAQARSQPTPVRTWSTQSQRAPQASTQSSHRGHGRSEKSDRPARTHHARSHGSASTSRNWGHQSRWSARKHTSSSRGHGSARKSASSSRKSSRSWSKGHDSGRGHDRSSGRGRSGGHGR